VKNVTRFVLALSLAVFLAGSVSAQRPGRKLPVGAYVKSAKIEILSGDPERYLVAIALLDSLFMNYGPHAEALDLMRKVMVDYVEKAVGPMAKMPYVEKMVAYNDSLKMCCADKKVDIKFKKGCDDYVRTGDSTMVSYWQQFYNDGVDQLKTVDEAVDDLKAEKDSLLLADLTERKTANIDSCLANFQLAMMVDSSDFRTYVGIASIYDKTAEYPKAMEWYRRGLSKSKDSTTLLLQVAYTCINMNQLCEAIPYFQQYVRLAPTDTANMINLAACYSNCKFFDSARAIYRQVLALDPNNIDALISIGQFLNQQARDASEEASKAQSANDQAKVKECYARRAEAFDSAAVYFKRAVDIQPDNPDALELYAVVNALRERYQQAAEGFAKLVELKPGQAEIWTSLGDCYLYLKDFAGAAKAYEKVVEIEPDNVRVLQNLVELYKEVPNDARQKEIEKKLQELGQ
jgi:tetratricopeptide (TPR) repeat protein